MRVRIVCILCFVLGGIHFSFAETKLVKIIGSERGGTSKNEFSGPAGVAFHAPSNQLYVADSRNNRIQVLDASGKFITEWAMREVPYGIGLNTKKDQVYVTFAFDNVVHIYNTLGHQLGVLGGPDANTEHFLFPFGVAVNQVNGTVYIVDSGNDRIQVFDSTGNFKFTFGTKGRGEGEFNAPGSIAIHPYSEYVYVSDTGNNRVQIFDRSGTFIKQFSLTSTQPNVLFVPTSITINSKTGHVYLLEEKSNKVMIFDQDGKYLRHFEVQKAEQGSYDPSGIAVDPTKNKVYVTLNASNQLQIYQE